MDELPVILTVGIESSRSDCLIKSILEADSQNNIKFEENTSSYSWEISNKYYSAKLQFRVFCFPDITSSKLPNAIEAVIIFFEFVSETFFNQLNQLNNILKNIKPAIKMVVCSGEVGENKKSSVEDWCIKNKFELIELKAESDIQCCDTDSEECCGIDRVKEVLGAHQWPNLVIKEKPSNSLTGSYSKLQNVKLLENGDECDKDGPSDCSNDEFEFEESLNDMEQLSTLFKDLQTMKRDISSLSNDEKYKQAEKVVKSFWRAMHGDSDEFSESEDES